MSDIQEANREKALGNECFTAKKYREAAQHFTKAIDLNPDDHVFYSNRSACYANLEEYDKALVDAQICVDIKPDWAKGYLRRGLAEYYLKKYTQAEVSYKKGLEIEPANQQLIEGLQKVQESKSSEPSGGAGSNVDKEKLFNDALNHLKTHPETSAYFDDPEFVRKVEEIKKNPMSAMNHMNDPKIQKAFTLLKSQFSGKGAAGSANNEEKKESHPAGGKKSSGNAEEEKTKGNEEYKKGNYKEAVYYYDEAIKINANEPIYHTNKAQAYLELKQPDQAIEACNKSIEICRNKPDSVKLAKALARKASALAQKKDYDQSLALFEQSLSENNDPKVREEKQKVEKLKGEA